MAKDFKAGDVSPAAASAQGWGRRLRTWGAEEHPGMTGALIPRDRASLHTLLASALLLKLS